MKKITMIFLAVILQTTLVKEAFSATAICSGKVTQIANHSPGGFYVRVGSSNLIRACSFDEQSYRVTPESCKSMMAMAMMARATDKNVTFYIDNAPTTDCASAPNWFGADTRYFSVDIQ